MLHELTSSHLTYFMVPFLVLNGPHPGTAKDNSAHVTPSSFHKLLSYLTVALSFCPEVSSSVFLHVAAYLCVHTLFWTTLSPTDRMSS